MNALPPLIFLAGVAWAIAQSAKRLMTVLWIAGSIVAVIGVMLVLSLAMPDEAWVLGHATASLVLLIPAIVGVGHARATLRKVPAPTQPS
jgi:hypothetical protein